MKGIPMQKVFQVVCPLVLTSIVFSSVYARAMNIDEADQAFRQKHYQTAITLYEKRLNQNPDDINALKYLGICHIKKNNISQAITYLKQAHDSSPQNESVIYYLASAYALDGQNNEASRLTDELIAAAPDSLYARKASDLRAGLTQRKLRKALSVYERISFQYDSNAALEPDKRGIPGLDKDSSRFTNYTWLEFILLQEKDWWAGINASFYQSLHTENDSQRLNLSNIEFGPFFSFRMPLGSYTLTNRLEYRFIYDILNGDSFVRTHRLRYSVSSYMYQWMEVLLYSEVDFDDFFYRSSADPDIFNRDAVQSESGIRFKFLLPEHRALYVGYDFTHNDAEGINWNYTKNRVFAEFATPFFMPDLIFYLKGTYYNRYFDPFSGAPYGSTAERDEDYYSVRARLRYNINKNTGIEASYLYSENQSTLEEYFEYERSIFDVSLILKF